MGRMASVNIIRGPQNGERQPSDQVAEDMLEYYKLKLNEAETLRKTLIDKITLIERSYQDRYNAELDQRKANEKVTQHICVPQLFIFSKMVNQTTLYL